MAQGQTRNTATTQPTRQQIEASNRKKEEAQGGPEPQRGAMPQGFTRISTDRTLYKAGESSTALRGDIIGVERVKEDGWRPGWKAMDVMILRVHHDAEWDLLDYKGNVSDHVVVQAGDDVMVILQAGLRKIASLDEFGELKHGLVKQAFKIGKAPEVFIEPLEKRPLPNGNSMWRWAVGCSAPSQWKNLAEVAPDQMGVGFDKELAEAVQAGSLGSAAGGTPRQLPAPRTTDPGTTPDPAVARTAASAPAQG